MNKNKLIFIIFISLVVGGVSYFISKDVFTKSGPDLTLNLEENIAENIKSASSTIKAIEGSNLAIEGEGDFKVNPIKIEEEKKLDSEGAALLDRVAQPISNIDQGSAERALEKISEISISLREDPENVENWLVLGVYRKIIGDYQGAADVWNYVGGISPDNYVSYNNLGELYAYYLKDNTKAEVSYKKAIENGKNMIFIYRNFHDFYRNVLKDEAKAKAILEQGIAANPDTSQDLQNLLNLYY